MYFLVEFGGCVSVEFQIVLVAVDEVITLAGFGFIEQDVERFEIVDRLIDARLSARRSIASAVESCQAPVSGQPDDGQNHQGGDESHDHSAESDCGTDRRRCVFHRALQLFRKHPNHKRHKSVFSKDIVTPRRTNCSLCKYEVSMLV